MEESLGLVRVAGDLCLGLLREIRLSGFRASVFMALGFRNCGRSLDFKLIRDLGFVVRTLSLGLQLQFRRCAGHGLLGFGPAFNRAGGGGEVHRCPEKLTRILLPA